MKRDGPIGPSMEARQIVLHGVYKRTEKDEKMQENTAIMMAYMVDDLIDLAIQNGTLYAAHRGSDTIELKDIEKYVNMHVLSSDAQYTGGNVSSVYGGGRGTASAADTEQQKLRTVLKDIDANVN
eukprot:GHVU01171163.1.p1 GENE.GHVU01171163.1~~GHVU01171163.1.p1  ORF type:complete len:125 (+),score=23.14 GHVU01171163.1:311-685(+)